jgi:N-acetylglucosamine malate deacetylase 1
MAQNPTAFAIVAHPDDVEFRMGGTLLLLKAAGWELHYLTIASGNCGSLTMTAAQTRAVRRAESRQAARTLGAHWHRSLCDDVEILYDLRLLRRLAAVIREVKPAIVLTHPPVDYMEDHTNTCRLAVTAAFVRGMPNFITIPRRPPCPADVTIYHCTPHNLWDQLRRPMTTEFFVNTTTAHAGKLEALAAHASQRSWLQASQGFDAMTAFVEQESRKLGRMSGKFRYAEGWWRHSHLGFCAEDADPLRTALGRNYRINRAYLQLLKQHPEP